MNNKITAEQATIGLTNRYEVIDTVTMEVIARYSSESKARRDQKPWNAASNGACGNGYVVRYAVRRIANVYHNT